MDEMDKETARLEMEREITENHACKEPKPSGSEGVCQNCSWPLRLHKTMHVEGLRKIFEEASFYDFPQSETNKIYLQDIAGRQLTAERDGNLLKLTIDDCEGIATFHASATHIGKILQLVVDQFFPGGTSDDFKSENS